ncbi:MAG: NTP transferase domain-containing protein [Desulfobacterales bacterium]|jgi:bifunctional UDP-N-acetylglucosamine pyrophosphorylase/glucosamine-1-phosphate N-acetyltransferase/UDP-N-acetylglucosamine pyrophosphorylase|nr:NTP transferase domain-containing protein [Desulfobacterales bacterium]
MNDQTDPLKNESCSVIILAAGLGKRMQSDKAKVLHEIMGRPMILYVVETARRSVGGNIIVVVGHQAEKVKAVISDKETVAFAFQEKQLGTGHAVLCALPLLSEKTENIVILCGDVPLLSYETVRLLISEHLRAGRDLTVLAVNVEVPTGYGRIIFDNNMNLLKIIEEADASDDQKAVKTINSGIYCVKRSFLCEALQKINMNNAQGELYLTDIIEVGSTEGRVLGVMIGSRVEETIGVNSREDLDKAEALMRCKRLETS